MTKALSSIFPRTNDINGITVSETNLELSEVFYDNYVVNEKTHTFVLYGEVYKISDYTINPKLIFKVPTQIGTYIHNDSMNDVSIKVQLILGMAQFEGEHIELIYNNPTKST